MGTIERRWQRAMFVAAILLAAALVAATQFLHPTEPVAGVGPDSPPQGVPLLYFISAGHHHTLVAYDWSGHRRGSITLPTWVDLNRVRMAPDGSSFVVDPAFDGDWLGYFDRLGNTLVETQTDRSVSQVWADDDRHLCLLADPQVVIRLPGSRDQVVNVPQVYGQPGSAGLAACSMRSNTAIFTAAGGAAIAVLRVNLSSGKTLNASSFPPDVGVVASVDGTLVAAGSPTSRGTVYRANDLARPLAQLPGSAIPMAFSGDGRSVLALDGTGLELVDWSSGRQNWHLDVSPDFFGSVLARPSGSDFVLALPDPSTTLNGVFVIRRDGVMTRLDHGRPVMW